MQIKQENDGHAVIDQLTGEEVLTCAINIGEQLLMSGAEISRVEDTIRRICAAYGIRQSHIFSIASCIIVTLETKDHKWITQTRRILSYGTDMWKLDRLNNLSRLICSTKPVFHDLRYGMYPYPLYRSRTSCRNDHDRKYHAFNSRCPDDKLFP